MDETPESTATATQPSTDQSQDVQTTAATELPDPSQPSAQTQTVQLTSDVQLTVEYKVDLGELIIATLLTTLIFVVVSQWIARIIFKRS